MVDVQVQEQVAIPTRRRASTATEPNQRREVFACRPALSMVRRYQSDATVIYQWGWVGLDAGSPAGRRSLYLSTGIIGSRHQRPRNVRALLPLNALRTRSSSIQSGC